MDNNTTLYTETPSECEAIDFIHFANTIADATVATRPLLSVDDMRANGARLIVRGFVIINYNLKSVQWSEGSCAPTLKELRKEIKERNPSYRSSNYDKQKCIDILLKLPCVTPGQVIVSSPEKMKYSTRCDAPQITNIIIYLRYEYLLRDKCLTRGELGNKEQNMF